MTDEMKQPRDENGHFVRVRDTISLREHFERILEEKDLSAEFKRKALELALNEARGNIEKELAKAKDAADRVNAELQKRLAQLESGGAPFASRLDQSLVELKTDVDTLNDAAVRTDVLEALRAQDAAEKKRETEQANIDRKAMKRTVIAALGTGGAALLIAIIRIVTELANGAELP